MNKTNLTTKTNRTELTHTTATNSTFPYPLQFSVLPLKLPWIPSQNKLTIWRSEDTSLAYIHCLTKKKKTITWEQKTSMLIIKHCNLSWLTSWQNNPGEGSPRNHGFMQNQLEVLVSKNKQRFTRWDCHSTNQYWNTGQTVFYSCFSFRIYYKDVQQHANAYQSAQKILEWVPITSLVNSCLDNCWHLSYPSAL